MKFCGFILVFTSATLGTAAFGQSTTVTGGDLLEACTRADMDWISFCNGYFQAAHDLGVLQGRICTDESITRTNLVEAYEQIAPTVFADDPSAKSGPALPVVVGVLSAKFPCQ